MENFLVSTCLEESVGSNGEEGNSKDMLNCSKTVDTLKNSKEMEAAVSGTVFENFGQELFKKISKKDLGRIAGSMLMISLFLCPILAVSCTPALLKTTPSSGRLNLVTMTTEEPISCLRDEHCDAGQFCHDLTKTCVPCLRDECLKWKRRPGTNACTKAQSNCGHCLPGYLEQHGHCQPDTSSRGNAILEDPEVGNQGGDTGFSILNWKSSDPALYLFVGLIFFCFLGTVSPLFVYVFHLRRRRLSLTPTDKEAMVPEEEFLRPPPYNPYDLNSAPPGQPHRHDLDMAHGHGPFTTGRPISRGHLIQEEHPRMAIAFNNGLFPTTLAMPEEESAGEVIDLEIPGETAPSAESPLLLPDRDQAEPAGGLAVEEAGQEAVPVPAEADPPPAEVEGHVVSPPLLQVQVEVNVVMDRGGDGGAEDPAPPVPPPVAQPYPLNYHNYFFQQSFFDLNLFGSWFQGQGPVTPDLDLGPEDVDPSDGVVPSEELPDYPPMDTEFHDF